MNRGVPYYAGSMGVEVDLLLCPKCFQMKRFLNLVGFFEEACAADCCAAFTGCVCKV